jgi:hypothetical protein
MRLGALMANEIKSQLLSFLLLCLQKTHSSLNGLHLAQCGNRLW